MSEWRDLAVCRTTDPEVFFSVAQESIRRAKSVCRHCPVKMECLADAMDLEMEAGYRFGVYGGLDADQRKRFAC